MAVSMSFIRKLEGLQPTIRDAFLTLMEELERQRQDQVTRDEFRELKDIVRELAEAQKRTEARVEELAEAQRRTETKIEELAEAQKRTEEEVRTLAGGLRETQKMVGALTDLVGYGLEDRAIKGLRQLLQNRWEIQVEGRLVRKFLTAGRTSAECNIFGKGRRDDEAVTLLGEAKSRLTAKHIRDFLKNIHLLCHAGAISEPVFPLMITYTCRPEVEALAAEKGVHLIMSYEV